MGGSISSNTAKVVSNVSSSVTNSVQPSVDTSAKNSNEINLNNCNIDVGNDFVIKQLNDVSTKSKQLVTSLQQTQVDNEISQKMVQEATSTVGSLGVGFADANNYVSTMSNLSTKVKNSLEAKVTTNAQGDNFFSCSNGTIKVGNDFVIEQSNAADLMSDQVVNSNQTTDIINEVSQTVDQKATAKVAGIAMFLFALAVLIIACGYGIAKPLTTGGGKIIILGVVVGVFVIVLTIMYINKCPPLFSDPLDCSMNDGSGICVKPKDKTVNIAQPPVRYLFDMYEGLGSKEGFKVDLVNMCINALQGDSNNYNSGYNMYVYKRIEALIKEVLDSATGDTKTLITKLFPVSGSNARPTILKNPNELISGERKYFPIIPPFIGVNGTKPEYKGSFFTKNGKPLTLDTSYQGACTPSIIELRGEFTDGDDPDVEEIFDKVYKPGLSNNANSIICPTAMSWMPDMFIDDPDNPLTPQDQDKYKLALKNNTALQAWLNNKDGLTNIEFLQKKSLMRLVLSVIAFRYSRQSSAVNPTSVSFDIYYMEENDFVFADNGSGSLAILPADPKKHFKFTPSLNNSYPSGQEQLGGLLGKGTIRGALGTLNTNQYKVQQFTKRIGIWLMLLAFIGLAVYMFIPRKQTENKIL